MNHYPTSSETSFNGVFIKKLASSASVKEFEHSRLNQNQNPLFATFNGYANVDKFYDYYIFDYCNIIILLT